MGHSHKQVGKGFIPVIEYCCHLPHLSLRQIYILFHTACFSPVFVLVKSFSYWVPPQAGQLEITESHPYCCALHCSIFQQPFSMAPLVPEYPDSTHSSSVQAACHSSPFSLSKDILPEAVIGSLTAMLAFSSSDGFVWTLVSLSGRLSGRLNWGKLPWVPFSCQAEKKKNH